MQWITTFDIEVVRALFALREPFGITLFSFITSFADTLTFLAILSVVAAWFLIRKHTGAALGVIVAALGAKITEVFLKVVIGRARPDGYELLQLDTFSFPSGHATAAMALYGFLAYVLSSTYPKYRVLIWSVSIFLILLIGISRVYLGVHFPSDIVGGYLVGLLWIFIGARVMGLFKFK